MKELVFMGLVAFVFFAVLAYSYFEDHRRKKQFARQMKHARDRAKDSLGP